MAIGNDISGQSFKNDPRDAFFLQPCTSDRSSNPGLAIRYSLALKGKCCLPMVAIFHAVRSRVDNYGPINTTVDQQYYMCRLWLARWWSCCPEASAAISRGCPPREELEERS